MVDRSPDRFPITSSARLVLVIDEPVPDREGYSAADAVIEVPVDAGLLADERLVERERPLVREVPGGGFAVELHSA